LASQLVAHGREGMLGDVEPERLLLQPQQLVLVPLLDGNVRVVLRLRLGVVEAEVEDRTLAGETVCRMAIAPGERGLEAFEHPLARGAGRVERAALDQRLQGTLVDDSRIDSLREVPDRLERPVLLARRDDRARGAVADVLHGVEAETDLPLDDG